MNSASSVFLTVPDAHAAELALPFMQRSVSHMPVECDVFAVSASLSAGRARRPSPLSLSFSAESDAAVSSSTLSTSESSMPATISAGSSASSLPVSATSSAISKTSSASTSSAFSRLASRLRVVSRFRARRAKGDFDRDQLQGGEAAVASLN